jgi:hypothetical protein
MTVIAMNCNLAKRAAVVQCAPRGRPLCRRAGRLAGPYIVAMIAASAASVLLVAIPDHQLAGDVAPAEPGGG